MGSMSKYIKVTTKEDNEDGTEFCVPLSEIRSLLEIHWNKKPGNTNGAYMDIANCGDGLQFYIHLDRHITIVLADKIGRFKAVNLLTNKKSVAKLFPGFF
jgi:hypothetical protein